MKELEPIIKYRMDDMEAKAYKISLMWQDECKSELPGEKTEKINTRTDPRKSNLFKYCYKMARELKGIIEDRELQLFVRAQIQILKSIKDGEIHALISPHCLIGEKAWKRWKLWKYRYDKILASMPDYKEMKIFSKESKIIGEIKATKDFLTRMGCLEKSSLKSNSDKIARWVSNGEVSCFYIILSPWIKTIDNLELGMDPIYYRSCVNPNVEEAFRQEFKHEFEEK